MNDAFIAGFVKAAMDKGLSDESIAKIFKLATADPNASQMFNQIGAQVPQQVPQQMPQQQQQMMNDPQHMAIIHQLLGQQGSMFPPQVDPNTQPIQ